MVKLGSDSAAAESGDRRMTEPRSEIPPTMSAVVRERYGGPEQARLVERPVPVPSADQVLVRIRSTSLNTADLDHLLGRPAALRAFTGLRAPRTAALGIDVAGEVVRVGTAAERLSVGDRVWGDAIDAGAGAFAEYVCADEPVLSRIPPSVSYEDAATVPHSAVLALQALEGKGPVAPGDRVLINGGGGQVGPWAIQLATAMGAEVTGVDHAGTLELMTRAGAAHVVDYREQDVTRGADRYDLVVDIAAIRSIAAFGRIVTSDGAVVHIARTLGGFVRAAAVGAILSSRGDRRMGVFDWVASRPADLDRLGTMLADGTIRPLVDSTCGLADVPAALARLHAGRARGKIVVTV